MGAAWGSQFSPVSQPSIRDPSFLLFLHLLYIPPGKRHHQSLKKSCTSPPASPTKAYFLDTTTAHFLGSKSGVIFLWAEHSWSICIKNQHSPDLPSCPAPPAWNSQAEQEHLSHMSTIQPWQVAPCSKVNLRVVGTAPGCSSQGHHAWPKLLSIMTSG